MKQNLKMKSKMKHLLTLFVVVAFAFSTSAQTEEFVLGNSKMYQVGETVSYGGECWVARQIVQNFGAPYQVQPNLTPGFIGSNLWARTTCPETDPCAGVKKWRVAKKTKNYFFKGEKVCYKGAVWMAARPIQSHWRPNAPGMKTYWKKQ